MKIISIHGLDGAGKSTIAKQIIKEKKGGHQKWAFVWCGWREFRVPPFAQAATIINYLRGPDSNSTPNNTSRNKTFLSWVYLLAIIIDHYIFTIYNLVVYSYRNDYIICDRYIIDVIVGFCAQRQISYSTTNRLLTILKIIYPQPFKKYFLLVPPETAYNRKDDIPSVEYLKIRSDLYKQVVREEDIKVIDGTKDIDAIVDLMASDIQ